MGHLELNYIITLLHKPFRNTYLHILHNLTNPKPIPFGKKKDNQPDKSQPG
ncbi:hypothetical protein Hanom_Chr02g00150121 [Helianthus anomalus]